MAGSAAGVGGIRLCALALRLGFLGGVTGSCHCPLCDAGSPDSRIERCQDAPGAFEDLAAANRETAKLWLVPGAGHTGAFGAAQREFQERVLGFFQDCQNLPPGIQVREK